VKTPCIDWRGTLRTTLVLALLAQAGAALAAGFDLAALSAELARNKSGQARFTEERFVTGIDSPLRASGVLSFVAPDRFTRQTLEPLAESMTVEGNTITLKRNGRSRQMAMDAVPELAALIAAVRGTLSGDAATLEKHFKVRVEGTAARWMLTLVPRDARLATQVRELQIAGLAGDVRSVALWLGGGDRSVMAVEPLQPLQPLTPASAASR
jgi:hypothetical protein